MPTTWTYVNASRKLCCISSLSAASRLQYPRSKRDFPGMTVMTVQLMYPSGSRPSGLCHWESKATRRGAWLVSASRKILRADSSWAVASLWEVCDVGAGWWLASVKSGIWTFILRMYCSSSSSSSSSSSPLFGVADEDEDGRRRQRYRMRRSSGTTPWH